MKASSETIKVIWPEGLFNLMGGLHREFMDLSAEELMAVSKEYNSFVCLYRLIQTHNSEFLDLYYKVAKEPKVNESKF